VEATWHRVDAIDARADSLVIMKTASRRRGLTKTSSRRRGLEDAIAVRNGSKSEKKPPTTSSLQDDARRWRKDAASPTIIAGSSDFHFHSVATGFLWCLQQKTHLFAQASEGVASIH
jgi:hypothetical protein